VSLLERFEELTAKDFAEDIFGKEEARTARVYPVGVIAGKAAGGHDAVDMRMITPTLTVP
jgi:hypothetical protein